MFLSEHHDPRNFAKNANYARESHLLRFIILGFFGKTEAHLRSRNCEMTKKILESFDSTELVSNPNYHENFAQRSNYTQRRKRVKECEFSRGSWKLSWPRLITLLMLFNPLSLSPCAFDLIYGEVKSAFC